MDPFRGVNKDDTSNCSFGTIQTPYINFLRTFQMHNPHLARTVVMRRAARVWKSLNAEQKAQYQPDTYNNTMRVFYDNFSTFTFSTDNSGSSSGEDELVESASVKSENKFEEKPKDIKAELKDILQNQCDQVNLDKSILKRPLPVDSDSNTSIESCFFLKKSVKKLKLDIQVCKELFPENQLIGCSKAIKEASKICALQTSNPNKIEGIEKLPKIYICRELFPENQLIGRSKEVKEASEICSPETSNPNKIEGKEKLSKTEKISESENTSSLPFAKTSSFCRIKNKTTQTEIREEKKTKETSTTMKNKSKIVKNSSTQTD